MATTIKTRNMMYVQQLHRLPNNMTYEDFIEHIKKNINAMRWGIILHDKDTENDNKTLKEPHVHLFMQFKNERSLNQVAKIIGDKPQNIAKWDDRPINGLSYLIHSTNKSRHKHQYSPDDVTANFDYISAMEKASKSVSKIEGISSSNKLNAILDLIALGDMTIEEAKEQLTGSEYAKASNKLQAVHNLFLERCALTFCKKMIEENRIVAVHWIYGETETGKTVLAKTLAELDGGNYYKTTTKKDPFQHYEAQSIIILDELRPETIPYSELLSIFEPFSNGDTQISSRYFNKKLSCHTFIITSPYSPRTFYEKSVPYCERNIDKPEQFYRRLSTILEMTHDYIYDIEYDSLENVFKRIASKTNLYSKKNHMPIKKNNLFDKI